jgi:hypothetical protein
VETDVFRMVNGTAALIYGPVWVVMQFGNGPAAVLLAGAAVLVRQFRIARDMLTSAGLAGLGASLLRSLVGREEPGGPAVGDVLHGSCPSSPWPTGTPARTSRSSPASCVRRCWIWPHPGRRPPSR